MVELAFEGGSLRLYPNGVRTDGRRAQLVDNDATRRRSFMMKVRDLLNHPSGLRHDQNAQGVVVHDDGL